MIFWRHLCSKISLFLNDWSIPIVFMWSLIRGYCNIPLRTTHFCSNVSTKRKKSITLVIILDLIHLAVWEYLPSIWKHIYYLPTGGNVLGVFSFNKLTDMALIRCACWFGVEVVGMISFFFLVFYSTICHHYVWCLNHSGWYFGNTK